MRVCVIPCDFGGSGMYRLLFPAQQLRDQYSWDVRMPPYYETPVGEGATLEHHVDLTKKYEGRTVMVSFFDLDAHILGIKPDLAVFQRPVDTGVPEIIDQVRANGTRVIVETDDYFAGLPAWNPASNLRHRSSRSTEVLYECAARADALTVSTPFLARHFQSVLKGRNVLMLPNMLWRPMWDGPPVYREKDWEGIRVGYMGDARWHSGDLKVIAGIIRPWLERNPDVKFVAQPPALDILEVPDAQRVEMGNVDFREFTLKTITATMDIGLVPLAKNNFNEGKSWLKGMEYAACGIPCIASDTESYRRWIEHGHNGFICRRDRDFARHLDTLVSDDRLRRRMAANAHAKALLNTIDRHAHLWAETWGRVAGLTERMSA